MAIAAKPKRHLSADPMAFITAAEKPEKPRKEPVIIRFDAHTLKRLDRAAARRGLSRAALVRMLVIENLQD
jgi:Ribbon-helix-helix protein, copG family